MSELLVPDTKSVKELLSMMYGESVDVSQGEVAPDDGWRAATYVNDVGAVASVCACDAPFVMYSGAALTMIPGNVANEMLSKKDFSEVILGNFHEIMNICSRLLMSDTTPHVRLENTMEPDASQSVFSTFAPEGTLAGFKIEIPSYGTGSLLFYVR
jgi:hypothetical protein